MGKLPQYRWVFMGMFLCLILTTLKIPQRKLI